MFRTQEGRATRARAGFGIVLVIGAVVMFLRNLDGLFPITVLPNATVIMALTWLSAFAAYGLLSRRRVDVEHAPQAFLKSSLVWPTLGLILMLPLLVHMPFALLIGGMDGFDDWVAISYPFTATTTFAAALLGTLRALELADGRRPTGILRPGAIYGMSLLLGLFPYGVFIIPPILIAITGAPFISLFGYQETVAARERELSSVPEIPAAIARFRAIT
jgi:hypothetical protein